MSPPCHLTNGVVRLVDFVILQSCRLVIPAKKKRRSGWSCRRSRACQGLWHMNALWRRRSQPGTHVGDFRPSVQRSSLRMSISDMAALTDRVSCWAPAALFIEAGKGRVAMRATYFRPRVCYARRTEGSCLASAAASVVATAAVRAWAKVEDTGLAPSPVTESLLSRSAEDATSTKEGVTFLCPVTTVTSPRSVL